jgi:hypothetical protein
MFPQSLKPSVPFSRKDVAKGGWAIGFATALHIANAYYLGIVRDYWVYQAADTVATVVFAACTFYVNRTPALARWWVGCAVAAVGLGLFYASDFFFLDLVRNSMDWVLPVCYGLSFGPLAWPFHYSFLPKTDPEAEHAHEEALHKVGACADPKFNIVFVHGVAGHHRTTWQAGENEANYWPDWVAEDFPSAQVYALQYNAAPSLWLGPTMPLIPRGRNLLNFFAASGIFRLPSVFIVHSFGGLVLKQLWRSAHQQNHVEALESVRAVIFLATPHHGSLLTYLNVLFVRLAGRTTQTAKDLAHHNQVLLDLAEFYQNRPVPLNYVYYETQRTRLGLLRVKVVDEASAGLGLPKVFPVGLLADHLTICKPSSREHDIAVRIRRDLETIASALFAPPDRSDRFEIDSYEIMLSVEPREMQDFQVHLGSKAHTVRCDNVAYLVESVTFARNNQLRSPYTLHYLTKNDGRIRATMSHTNEASAEEKARHETYGYDVTFTFTPDAGETYRLNMQIYKGFDEGQRYVQFRLPTSAYYKSVKLTLNLHAYVEAGYAVQRGPQLYRHQNYDVSASPDPIGELVSSVTESGAGEWQWELRDVDRGVLNLIWDVTPQASAGAGAASRAGATQSETHDETVLSPHLDGLVVAPPPQNHEQAAGQARPRQEHQASRRSHGAIKLEFSCRMVRDWDKLADYLEIPLATRARFQQGREPQEIWEWLEQRGRLDKLKEALIAIDRPDVAEILPGPFQPRLT